jgi:high-affinity iron transporter
MISSLLIGLREGLEASIIVAILIAYLVKRDFRSRLPRVWFGVAMAVAVSIGTAGILFFTSQELPERTEQIFAGTTSIAAAGLITWLTFWMAQHARNLKNELHEQMDKALLGSSFALSGVAFFAVVREGLETAVFMFSSASVSGSGYSSLLGLLLGLGISIATGYLVFKGVLKLNIGKVFQTIGALLIVVAAGVLTYGLHELQEAGVIGWSPATLIDTTGTLDPEGLVATLLRGFLAYRGEINVLDATAWLSFVAVVGTLYVNKVRLKPAETKEKVAA